LGYVEYATIIDELARVDPSIALAIAAHNSLGVGHIFIAGSDAQKDKYLTPLAKGEHFAAWGLTEPSSGSDAISMKTTAVRRDGGWVLNGSKNFITNATFAETTVALAITDRAAGSHGISAFIIERGTKGFSVAKKENKVGMRASDTASLVFDDCFVPNANLMGAPGQGFIQAMKVLDGGRISIAALAVGIAQGAYEAALKYSRERHQFGRPIAEFQAIQFKLADMATQVDAARLLTYRAAAMKDAGKPTTKESSMAKLYASEVGVRVAEECVQIHGGYGYIKDYPAEKYWRDSKLCTIGEGTSEIQRTVIARQILRA
jgi:alkylation response protein AidB-like acyl-CoA dehydrogenase